MTIETSPVSTDSGAWRLVCPLADIWPDAGVAAMIDGHQIAVFRIGSDGPVHAIDNRDPQSGANVLSRGLTGSLGERVVVASPIYKQHYELATGICLEDASLSVRAYPTRVEAGQVWVCWS